MVMIAPSFDHGSMLTTRLFPSRFAASKNGFFGTEKSFL